MVNQKSIWTMGEILVEIMRPQAEMPLNQADVFMGPFPSGAPAIFIDTVARLGRPAGIIGGVGQDDFGDCVRSRLLADGVDCRYVQAYPGESTAVAFVTYFSDGSRRFLYHIDHTPAVMTGFSGTEAITDAGFFHVMGCSLMVNPAFRAEIFKAMNACYQMGAKISFDPNIRVELLRGQNLEAVIGPVLDRCAVLLPGIDELALLSKTHDIDAGVSRLFERYPLEVIVLKRGRIGCTVYARGEAGLEIPAYQADAIDPTGAGDCFDAGFLCGLLDGKSLFECGQIASAAGALNTAAFGPMEGRITPETVREVIANGSVR